MTFTNYIYGMGNMKTENYSVAKDERACILYEFNHTPKEFVCDKTVAELFEEQVRKTPENTAIIDQNNSLSYYALNELSNAIARKLRNAGVGQGDFAAVMISKRIEIIAGIIGILKAGGAYVPIDPANPPKRINEILSICKPRAVLVYAEQMNADIPVLDLAESRCWQADFSNPATKYRSDSVIYCMFTSGTTGVPKGSLIEHRGVVRLVKDTDYVKLDERTVMAQVSTLAFDASTFEIWGALLNGGKLVLADRDTILDAGRLKAFLNRNQVNTMFITTALYNQMIQADITIFDGLKFLLFGGEKASDKHVRMLRAHNTDLHFIHCYGPTENTTFTTAYEIPVEFAKLPIGKPIRNTQVYIMQGDSLCGIGVPGELCTAGLGVSRGYLENPQLTAEKFIDNPFGEGKMYRSGDLAMWLPDGNIEFLGRIDEQVKIRGYRIEIGDIENAIRKTDKIKDCTVLVKEKADSSGDKAIHAYFVADEKLNISELKTALKAELPDYMIPTHWMQIDHIPINPNGKVDRNALPEIIKISEAEFIAPRNEMEAKICHIFAQILLVNQLGIYDSFTELGGDSIKAIYASYQLRLNHLEVSVTDILHSKNIEELALKAYKTDNNAITIQKPLEIVAAAPDEVSVKIWKTEATTYHYSSYLLESFKMQKSFAISCMYQIQAEDISAVRRIATQIIHDQEIFRTAYSEKLNEFIIYSLDADRSLQYIDFQKADEDEIITRLDRSFEDKRHFSDDELLACMILVKTKGSYYLYVNAHHMIWDGVSNLIFKNMIDLYAKAANYSSERQGRYHQLLKKRAACAAVIDSKDLAVRMRYHYHFLRKLIVKRQCSMISATVILSEEEMRSFNSRSTVILLQLFIRAMFAYDIKCGDILFWEIENGRDDTNYSTLGMFAVMSLKKYNIESGAIDSICNELNFSQPYKAVAEIYGEYGDACILINNTSSLAFHSSKYHKEGIVRLDEKNISLAVVSTVSDRVMNICMPSQNCMIDSIPEYIKTLLHPLEA